MESQWPGILIGASLSIPIGIVINLLTPQIQRRIDRRIENQALVRNALLDERAKEFSKDLRQLWNYVLVALLRAMLTLGLTVLTCGILYVVETQVSNFVTNNWHPDTLAPTIEVPTWVTVLGKVSSGANYAIVLVS